MQMTRQENGFTLGLIPDGPAGIDATLKIMSQFVRAGKTNPSVFTTARSITQQLGQKDWAGEVKLLHAFVRDKIRYIADVTDVESVQTPDATLRFQCGDCDDKTVLLCALLESCGHPTRFVAIGFEPNTYEHVYCQTIIGPHWISLETTEDVEAGWAPPESRIMARKIRVN